MVITRRNEGTILVCISNPTQPLLASRPLRKIDITILFVFFAEPIAGVSMIANSAYNPVVFVDKDLATCLTISDAPYPWVRLKLPKNTREVKHIRVVLGTPVAINIYVGYFGNKTDAKCQHTSRFDSDDTIFTCADAMRGTFLTIFSQLSDIPLNLCEVEALGSSK